MKWVEKVGLVRAIDESLNAICDRVLHNAHLIQLQGPSMRQRKGLKATKH